MLISLVLWGSLSPYNLKPLNRIPAHKGADVDKMQRPGHRVTDEERRGMRSNRQIKGSALLCACSLVVMPGAWCANGGTVVIALFDKNRIVLAADSRATGTGGAEPTYDNCKLATFHGKIAFGLAGIATLGEGPGRWDAAREAHRVVNEVLAGGEQLDIELLKKIGLTWADLVRNRLERSHSAIAEAIEITRSSHVADGIFAAAVGPSGQVAVLIAYVKAVAKLTDNPPVFLLESRIMTEPTRVWTNIAIVGKFEIAAEFWHAKTTRAAKERARWKQESLRYPRRDRLARRAIRLAELTAQEMPDDVGGPVDALEIARGGVIRWIQRKPNCQTE